MGFLDGIRVVDFGQFVAGPVAAMFLADQGADVVRVERPSGPSYDTAANATWNRGKRSLCLDLKNPREQVAAKGLIVDADIVIENFRPGVMDRLGLGYETTRALNPGLIYASLPAFGRRDQRRNVQGWEGVVLAAADVFRPRTAYRHMLDQIHTDPVDRAGTPVFTGEPIASMYAALIANVGILAALTARERSGQGQHVEAPLFDSFMQSVGILGMAKVPFRRPSTDSFGPWDHQYRCADGRWVHVVCIERKHAEALAELIKEPSLIDLGLTDPALVKRPEHSDQVRGALTEAFKTAPAKEWETQFESLGIPGAICRTTKEWLDHPQASSGLTLSVHDPVLGQSKQPAPIVLMSENTHRSDSAAPHPGQHREEVLNELAGANPFEATDLKKTAAAANLGLPLSGVRVLDLSTVLAGPTCGRTLAELGADVIKINDPKRKGVPFHHDVNRGKRSILLDLASVEGLEIFWELVDTSDVVIENFRSGVSNRLGIGYDELKARKSDIIYSSITAFGTTGPWAEMPGYEETVEAATGMQCRFGGAESPEVWPFCTINDYGTGLATATGVLLALLERSVSGHGQRVDASLARTAGVFQSQDMIDFDSKKWRNDQQSEFGLSPVYRIYQCQDRWIFLGTTSREKLEPLLGETVQSTDGFALQLSEWCRRRPAAEAVSRLLENNIGAQELLWLNDVMMDPHVVGAGLSVVRDHEGIGLLRTTGPGTWLSESTVTVGKPATIPGTDIESVLEEIDRLGDLVELSKSGAIGLPAQTTTLGSQPPTA